MNAKATEKRRVYFSWIWLIISALVFLVASGPHLWAVITAQAVFSLKTIAANIFWSCVLYSLLLGLFTTDYKGRCHYCNKGVYNGHHRIEFDWEEKTTPSQKVVELQKIAHYSCHENAPPEKKFKFPTQK